MGFFILIIIYSLLACFTFSVKDICLYVFSSTFELFFIAYFLLLLLLRKDNVRTNPGPKRSFFTFCHWNLNGLATHGFAKISLMKAFINTHDFDIICLSETYLDSTIPRNVKNINHKSYSLSKVDHPSNSKCDDVCLYHKEYLPLMARNDLFFKQKCLVTELSVNN